MKNTVYVVLFIALAAVALSVSGCSSGNNSAQTAPNGNSANGQAGSGTGTSGSSSAAAGGSSTDSTNSSASSTGNVREIQMTAKQFEFIPSTITVKKGDTVKLIVTSIDVHHGLAIPQFGVNLNLPPHVPETVQFVADKAGQFSFYCDVYCGAGHRGMRGTLIVTE